MRWQPVAGPPLLSIPDLPVVGTTRSSLQTTEQHLFQAQHESWHFFLKPVFISWGCGNKGPTLVASNNRNIFSRSSGGQKMESEVSEEPYSPSRGAGRVCHSQPPASRSSWAVAAQARSCQGVLPTCTSVSSHTDTSPIGLGPTLPPCDLMLLITSATTLFPNKVTFWVVGSGLQHRNLRGHNSTHNKDQITSV